MCFLIFCAPCLDGVSGVGTGILDLSVVAHDENFVNERI